MNVTYRYLPAALWLVWLTLSGAVQAAPDDDVTWIADKRGCKVANTFPRPGESITWSGQCKSGFADGDGVLQWFLDGKKDDVYEGHLAMGWADGKGVMTKTDGGKYAGDWKHSTQDGTGRFDAPDGSWYEGQWKNGKPHGHAVFTLGQSLRPLRPLRNPLGTGAPRNARSHLRIGDRILQCQYGNVRAVFRTFFSSLRSDLAAKRMSCVKWPVTRSPCFLASPRIAKYASRGMFGRVL
jgi:hypothetical protein